MNINTCRPPWWLRVGIGATLAVSGVIHAYLYVHGYRYIPTIGPAFLLQASVFLCSGRADPRRRTGLAAVGRGCGLRRGAGRVRAVADCRALRVHRTRMAAVTACRRQRDRRGAHRGIGCRLGAEQPQQNRSNITAATQIAALGRRGPFDLPPPSWLAWINPPIHPGTSTPRYPRPRRDSGMARRRRYSDLNALHRRGGVVQQLAPADAFFRFSTNMRRHHASFFCY